MSAVLPQHETGARPAPACPEPFGRVPRRRVLACWHALAFYFCLIALGMLMLGSCLVGGLLSRTLAPGRRYASGRALISWCARSFFRLASALGLVRLDLSALDALNAESGLIIAPNHPSMLDALLVASRVRRTGCIMKAGLCSNPFLGAGARLAGYIGNGSVNGMIRQAAADLRSGGKVLIFPEATRSPTATSVNALTAGIALIAQRAEAPIQTVLIEAESPYLGKGWPLLRLPALPLRYRATLGPRFVVQADRRRTLSAMHRFYADALGNAEWQRAPARAGARDRVDAALADV